MKNQESLGRERGIKRFISCAIYLLPFTFFNLPPAAATENLTLSVVYSQENSSQWAGITNRLQSVGVKYCVIPLAKVRTMKDWGERRVLLMPNVETLTPAQGIALEEWMNQGGRLIASGPFGSLSAPGVRQLSRMLLGGYWGFTLNEPQNLQPAKNRGRNWPNKKELIGQVRGGVLVPEEGSSQVVAVWDTKDNPAAVIATDNSTFFGWRWGADVAAAPELDTAWFKVAFERHQKVGRSSPATIPGGSTSCETGPDSPPTAALTTPAPTTPKPTTQGRQRNQGTSFSLSSPTIPLSRRSLLPPSPPPRRPSDEAIDQLQDRVGLDINPNDNRPINRNEAIALQQELDSLIGRVQSAKLTALANGNNFSVAAAKNPEPGRLQATTVAGQPGALAIGKEQVVTQARAISQNLPVLISQRRFAEARRQFVIARGALWQQFPLNRRLAQPEIRSVWLDRGTIVRAGSEQGLAQIFDRLAQAGINTIFFETVNASYTIYPSQVAPQQNPLIRGWDPLASAVKLAKERGIELHAWVWVFAAGNQRHNQILGIDQNYPGPVLAKNPTWAGYDNRGQMIPLNQGKPFFDPANPELRQYLLRLYEEIVTRYDVDGLQLDYIRYPFQDPQRNRTYGYGSAGRAQFQQLTGVDPTSINPNQRELWQKWTEFRTEQVNSFVAQVSQQLRQKKPNLILSVAVFPLPEQERIQKIQQHWEVWARRGDIDLIVPMTYATDTTRFARLAQPWIASTQLGATLLVPGMRLLNLSTVGAFDQIQLIRDLPALGYALFAAQDFNSDIQNVFNNTQGTIPQSNTEPIPHRQPFQTAALRYKALQREWQVVTENNQLKMSSTNLGAFNSQAEILSRTLEQLAEKPDKVKLASARASLFRFQSQFRIWMQEKALENPYQVRAWENRLVGIERLLRYGERVIIRS